MIRIQNMDTYWADINRLAKDMVDDSDLGNHDSLVDFIAQQVIAIDIQRAAFKITDKELEDAIRDELYRQIHKLNVAKSTEFPDSVKEAFAASHGCCIERK